MSNRTINVIMEWSIAICLVCCAIIMVLGIMIFVGTTLSDARALDGIAKECKQQGFIQDQHTRINCTVVAE